MEINQLKSKIIIFVKKYKYAALILAIGIALMLLPNNSNKSKNTQSNTISAEMNTDHTRSELADILSKVEGAGRVEVMLTVSRGSETVFQTNTDQGNSEQSADVKSDTVVLTDSNRNEYGLIKRVDPVQYMGAIVLCQGADSSSVRLAIIEAVSKTTGLGADRICVLKMK